MLKLFCIAFMILSSQVLSGQQESSQVAASWRAYVNNRDNSLFSGLLWQQVGPVLNSGRVESLAVNPDKPWVIYAGFGSGNLWKTSNNGLNWLPIFDDQAAYSIGDICIAPSNPEILYVGTGENLRAMRGHTIPGSGIFRSDDAGETWRFLGLEKSFHIARVAVHPQNPDIVLIAVLGSFFSSGSSRGIFKSMDGGRNWSQVLFVNDVTGASDVVFAPSDPNILYASTWQCGEAIGGPGSGVYKSMDGGDTWTLLQNGLPTGPMNGRTGLAVSYQNPNRVYALTDNLNRRVSDGTAELYKSDDGGLNWYKTHEGGLKIFSSFGHVFTDCFINPKDDNEIYLLGVNVLRSADGGKTMIPLRGEVHHLVESPAHFFHLDHHDLWINPNNPEHLIAGNDGGVYISYDKAQSWHHLNNIPVGEFYFVSTDNAEPYRIYGGTQDDAAVRGPAKSLHSIGSDGWEYVWIDPWAGGDGIVTEPDPQNPEIVYYESQNGHLMRKDMISGESILIKPTPPDHLKERWYNEWLTPYIVGQHQPGVIYYGSNYVCKSMNRGDEWTIISDDLSVSADPGRKGGGITALAESRLSAKLLYAGTARGALWISQDEGKHWDEISIGLPAKYVKCLVPSRFKKDRVYAVLSGIREDDFTPMVYRSDDFGKTWEPIAEGLAGAPVNVIVEDPKFENLLYTGTFNGVYVSSDRGKSWNALGNGIPHAFVADMTIQERESDLIAATHGRGMYVMDLEPLHAWMKKPAKSLAILNASNGMLPAMDASGSKPDLSTRQEVIISFYIPVEDSSRLTIVNSEQKVVFTQKVLLPAGLHTRGWNMELERKDGDDPYFFQWIQLAPAGNYEAVLEQNSLKATVNFKILSQ